MTQSVVLRRCATLSEAYICVGLLYTRGIWAALDNAEYAAVDWGSIPAIGGVHVRVLASEYEAAKQTIIESVETAPALCANIDGAPEEIPAKRRWRAITMLLIWFGIVELVGSVLIYVLDAIIPRHWVPSTGTDNFWLSVSPEINAAPPGPGAGGLVLIMLIGFFLFWELVSTRPPRPKREPSV